MGDSFFLIFPVFVFARQIKYFLHGRLRHEIVRVHENPILVALAFLAGLLSSIGRGGADRAE